MSLAEAKGGHVRYIWLFGENQGRTANNNSFYFWRHIVGRHDDLDAYFVMEKNEQTLAAYRGFTDREKRYTVWRNSAKHIALFHRADMLFVSLSFTDVQPERIGPKSYKPMNTQPLVYLQHGTLAMKRLEYKNFYANNSLFRWVYYNPNIPQKLIDINGFRPYQLMDGMHPPRYMEMIRRAREAAPHRELRILWFMTWREYFGDNWETRRFLKDVQRVLTDGRLAAFLRDKPAKIRICLHDKFTDGQTAALREAVRGIEGVELTTPRQISVMDALAQDDLLITDYSSIGFDFTFLKKPVILYQSDLKYYSEKRAFYCDMEEMEAASLHTAGELVSAVVAGDYGVNPFFTRNMPERWEGDEEFVLSGGHIERMYSALWEIQRRSVAFLGYDFSGIGGTVFATRALAEGLLEAGYTVRMITCKQMKAWHFPAGAPMLPMYFHYNRRLIDRLKVKLIRGRRLYRHLACDPAVHVMAPVSGVGMTYWMKRIHARTVISTRESLHFFLKEAASPMIQNKIYFFHTSAEAVEELFPGAMKKLGALGLEKAVFVTERNRRALAERCGFAHDGPSLVLGNALDSERSLAREQVALPPEHEGTRLCCLMRLGPERRDDVARMLQFARYVKAQGMADIRIDVYGSGECTDMLRDAIEDEELGGVLAYCGTTGNARAVYGAHDAAVDFSAVQSFGMTYIEAILCGRMVFCRMNEGSGEVLAGMDECFYETDEELLAGVRALKAQRLDDLLRRYDAIAERYSRHAVTKKLVAFMEG